MNNYKIVIDAGHGGTDSGASGNGIVEKDLNLKISQYMYERFRTLGIPVVMTRTTDETISPSERVNRILNAFGNNSNVIVISNHINAGGGDGAEVIYALRNTSILSNLVLEELEKEGQNVRKAYQRRYPTDTSKDYYFIQRETGITQPITVEYGFLDSTGDDIEQLKNNYKRYAEAVVRAVLEYIDIDYEDTTNEYYIVKSGDSLYSIASKYGLTVNELKEANNLVNNVLNVGQKLIIPSNIIEEEIEGFITYTVKSGDSLYNIAKRYNITVDELKKINNLNNNLLTINQKILIPTGKEIIEATYNLYTVKGGDNLYSLANKYGISINEIKDFNNLTSNNLSIGQQLKIPTGEIEIGELDDYITYTVQKGDNLYSIGKKFNVTQSEIMNYNNLTNNLLSIGQQLKIPNSTPNQYVVKSGDSLYSIAKKFNTTVNSIKSKNNLTSNLLNIGQILTI